MATTDLEFQAVEKRMQTLRDSGYAVSARYDKRLARIVIDLNTAVQIAVPAQSIEGLADASAEELGEIEISPSGLGLHWPRLDADIYVPGLLQGVFGSRHWMAAQLGAVGGRAKSASKVSAARENGRKGGRPRKVAAA